MLLGDHAAADPALDRVLAAEPANLYALCMKGDVAAALGDDRKAANYYQFALGGAPASGLSADLVARLQAARAALGALQHRFRQRLDDVMGSSAGPLPARFREAMAILNGEAQPYPQQPTSFYYPRLAPVPFFETGQYDWAANLEAAAPAICAELCSLLEGEEGFQPYVQADPNRPNRGHALLDDPRWSAFHLWQDGRPVPANADRCPTTMAILAEMPIPRIEGRSPMALFSLLRPHTHIPPHTGMLNTRLICHLPLIVPEHCRLRVGAETRKVERFKALLFDDSIEHEAWNDSDEVRIVLLFEVWRPDIEAEERALLTRMFETVVGYGQ
ncbi:aspartyl/asparaginyl beta-hydroxylase domain-containing protein [Sphingomonas sp. PR090111-T3T-6A]|uniref:aspartyl/asparaginyl beta-hydroxylase domain-containing protein n=1 Tax=Sphingomonas sp. PR090111-T3T-6A TaxID=685778 RepID=UPI000367C9AB|nr:aspartyl/asparaginyl beta-hydroxylase domain-containing protein [Sphingomonas sp. PR090111-T3T-6A]